jgi:hypothetical protein
MRLKFIHDGVSYRRPRLRFPSTAADLRRHINCFAGDGPDDA